MKKNNRQQYLKTWLTFLKGKNQIDPNALADFLWKTLKGAFSSVTMKRYTATVIGNLYENGFLAGKTGKTFSGEPLEIVREITLPVLDKCLTHNYKKIKFTYLDQPAEPVEPVAKTPKAKKPKKVSAKKKPAPKPVKAKAKKPVGRKPGPQKRIIEEKPKKEIFPKVQIVPGKTTGRKPAVKKTGLIGRKTDLIKMGEGAFLYSLELTRRVEEMEREIAGYQKVFEAIRGLFSREMDEIEEWLGVVLK
jgi:hypothetical protein